MYVVRPKGILTTPMALAEQLDAHLRYYPNPRRVRLYDYRRDFFMGAVAPEHVRNAPHGYQEVFNFFSRDKYSQRLALSNAGIPIPRIPTGSDPSGEQPARRYVVRPLRHSAGRGYRVTESATDFVAGKEYIAELYPKKREYRVIFAFGNPILTLRKKPNEGVDHEQPWGHSNSFFQTVNDTSTCRLAQTDFYHRLSHNPVIRFAHLVAVDVLWNPTQPEPYVVLEFNACPGIALENNQQKLVETIRARNVSP
jgi:hypothetical protein